MPRRGPRVEPLTLRQLEDEIRRMVRGNMDVVEARRLLRFAVEFERAIYEGRIDPDLIPRDVLVLLTPPRAVPLGGNCGLDDEDDYLTGERQ